MESHPLVHAASEGQSQHPNPRLSGAWARGSLTGHSASQRQRGPGQGEMDPLSREAGEGLHRGWPPTSASSCISRNCRVTLRGDWGARRALLPASAGTCRRTLLHRQGAKRLLEPSFPQPRKKGRHRLGAPSPGGGGGGWAARWGDGMGVPSCCNAPLSPRTGEFR